jgi:hypothetical protein
LLLFVLLQAHIFAALIAEAVTVSIQNYYVFDESKLPERSLNRACGASIISDATRNNLSTEF